jgi:hypothetical protein
MAYARRDPGDPDPNKGPKVAVAAVLALVVLGAAALALHNGTFDKSSPARHPDPQLGPSIVPSDHPMRDPTKAPQPAKGKKVAMVSAKMPIVVDTPVNP